jgi:hypothetical protein
LVFNFPGGILKTVEIPATAGNDTENLSPGSGVRWVVLYGRIQLEAVGAGNRAIRVQLTDGTDVLVEFYQTGNITAGQTKVLNLAGWGMNPGNLSGVNDFIQGIGMAILEGDDQFRVFIGGGIANDSYSGYLRVLEIGGA